MTTMKGTYTTDQEGTLEVTQWDGLTQIEMKHVTQDKAGRYRTHWITLSNTEARKLRNFLNTEVQ